MMKDKSQNNEINIRLMTLSDIDSVLEIEKLSFKTPWSKESFESEIMDNNLAYYMVLEYKNHIVAYGGMWFVIDEGHITNIAVHPVCRGRGWGKKLVKNMMSFAYEKEVRRMTLEVRTKNVPAIKLYEKMGFKGCGVRAGYYQDTGEDALIMWADINPDLIDIEPLNES